MFDVMMKFETDGVASITPEADKLWHIKVCGCWRRRCNDKAALTDSNTASLRKLW